LRDVGAYIREQRRLGHLSLRTLSARAGISNPYLSQIERGLRRPSFEILQRLARSLEISAETLYIRAGMLDERPEGVDVAMGIAEDPHLTEPQKHELLALYRSYRRENEEAAAQAPASHLPDAGPDEVESHAARRR
jgi:transcriptional regulator with XRE-family HTH domain